MSARVRDDRLVRWSLFAAVPFVWLAVALVNPIPLLVPPLIALGLWTAMRAGLVDRFEPEEPDLF
jgi:hypothetical protein